VLADAGFRGAPASAEPARNRFTLPAKGAER
jgi:hypothetical protein